MLANAIFGIAKLIISFVCIMAGYALLSGASVIETFYFSFPENFSKFTVLILVIGLFARLSHKINCLLFKKNRRTL